MKNILINKTQQKYKLRRIPREQNYYTPEQLMNFLNFLEEKERLEKFVYFRLLAFTGLRRGEALALE